MIKPEEIIIRIKELKKQGITVWFHATRSGSINNPPNVLLLERSDDWSTINEKVKHFENRILNNDFPYTALKSLIDLEI